MKKFTLPIAAFCIMLISFIGCTASPAQDPGGDGIGDGVSDVLPGVVQPGDVSPGDDTGSESVYETTQIERGEFRAVWVATVLNLDFPSQTGLSAAAMKHQIDSIVADTVGMGLNTIIFQVRPAGDAFYESDIYPWSKWLTGEQGRGISGFDPLAYWIEACHENNVELHAWLNPYRIIHSSDNSSDPATLAINNPVRLRPELSVAWSESDGRKGLYLDPGLPEARQLIFDGITEIITKYDVDGIHIDDYFYPGIDFDDSASFAAYGGDLDLDDWRRENVNKLIYGIKAVIDDYNETSGNKVAWGVSPTAIWKNASSDPLGIPTTRGRESYHALYADTRRWVEEKWVDYICPQIYWYIGYDIADFEAIFIWWDELCAANDVELYVGHAAYREFEGNQPPNWEGEMVRQLEMISASDTADGSVFFRYGSLRGNVGLSVRDFYALKDGTPREPVIVLDTLSVGFPSGDATINAAVSNAPGYNIIGTSVPGIPLYINGEMVTGRTSEGFFHVFPPLEPGDNVFTFSQDGQDDVTRVITLKEPSGGGGSVTLPKTAEVTALDYATVTADDAWVYSVNSTNNGIGYMLTPGQVDRIVARSESNSLVLLSCGAWVRTDAVSIKREPSAITDVLHSGVYRSGQDGSDYDYVVWSGNVFPAATASYDGTRLTVKFGMHSTPPELTLPANPADTVFRSVNSGTGDDGVPYWEFAIRSNVKLEGYYIDYEDGKFRLCLKKRKTLSDGVMPLDGFTIVLDPGHGGNSLGALGPLGSSLPESALNLIYAQKLAERLEALGADVILTRENDTELSLQRRVDISRAAMPDIFISLHINSIAETVNSRELRGFTVWHQNAVGLPLAEKSAEVMQYVNPATNRSRVLNQSNFFVCRPWWSPHILFEASFISSIDDFVLLIDEMWQDRYAGSAVDMILQYFS